MSKALQIVDMLNVELKGEYSLSDCVFIDDDLINTDLVNQELPEVKTFHITNFYEGFTEAHVEQLLRGEELSQAPLLPQISFLKLRVAFDFLEKIQKKAKPGENNLTIGFQEISAFLDLFEEKQALGPNEINEELVKLGKLAKP